jgi:hypothetical protein
MSELRYVHGGCAHREQPVRERGMDKSWGDGRGISGEAAFAQLLLKRQEGAVAHNSWTGLLGVQESLHFPPTLVTGGAGSLAGARVEFGGGSIER